MMPTPEPVPDPMLSARASPELTASVKQALALKDMLEEEFEALRVQDLDAFEAMQDRKLDIFQMLNALTRVGTPESLLDKPEWAVFRQTMQECRELHRRNEVLISRKLDAIRGTLNTLLGTEQTASVETYDRMGRLSRTQRGRGFEEV